MISYIVASHHYPTLRDNLAATVKGVDDDGNSAVALGDPLFFIDGDTPQISKKASGLFFGYALEARGMLASDVKGRFILSGDIQDLRSQLLVHPYGYARIRVNVIEAVSGRVLFTHVYEGERQSNAYRPGSGSPVPILRDLTSRALQEAVDRALDDTRMRAQIGAGTDSRPRYTPGML